MVQPFQRELLARLPLAEATLRLFAHVLAQPVLDGLFQQYRGRCYQRQLEFSQLVYLIRDALLIYDGSGRQSFLAAQQQGQLPVAMGSAYEKLSHLPLELSCAMLEQGSLLLEQLRDGPEHPVAPSLSPMDVVIVDGKTIKDAARRLKPLRGIGGKLLGGKILAALRHRSAMVLAMAADPDGHRSDLPLLPMLLERLAPAQKGLRLWVMDRLYCQLTVMRLLCQRREHLLIRYSHKTSFHADLQRPAQHWQDAQGRRLRQEWGWLGAPRRGYRPYVRRIHLERPGQEAIVLVTDLLDEQQYPAQDLLDTYLQRWGIEQVFQQVVEVFALKQLIGSTPQGMIFQAALCLLLYNMIQLVRGYVAVGSGQKVEAVSTEMLFGDVQRQLISWSTAADPAATVELLAPIWSRQKLRQWLPEKLSGLWKESWRKSPTGPRRPRQPLKPSKGRHTSVWAVLQQCNNAAKKKRRP